MRNTIFLLKLSILYVTCLTLSACISFFPSTHERLIETDDTAIRGLIRLQMQEEDLNQGPKVATYSYNGYVYLIGAVSTEFQKKAIDIATNTKGVKTVTTQWFTPNSNIPLEDIALTGEIKKLLANEEYTQATYVDLVVYAKTVVLVGIVNTPLEAQKIEEIAKNTPNVKQVISYLQY